MARNGRNFKHQEECLDPDLPNEMVVALANNKPIAERFINVFRLDKFGVKNNGRC